MINKIDKTTLKKFLEMHYEKTKMSLEKYNNKNTKAWQLVYTTWKPKLSRSWNKLRNKYTIVNTDLIICMVCNKQDSDMFLDTHILKDLVSEIQKISQWKLQILAQWNKWKITQMKTSYSFTRNQLQHGSSYWISS